MDALVVVADGRAVCRRLRDIRAGDQVVVGMRGIRVIPESKERDRLAFAFMANGISSERQVETAVRQTATLIEHTIAQGLKVVAVAGPVVVHTGGVNGLAELIRRGFIHVLLSGNALGVHDVEAALFGTSLGVRLSDGRQEEHGHRNHMRAINAIYHCGSVRQAVESYNQAFNLLTEKAVNVRSEARDAYRVYRSTYDIASHYQREILPLRQIITEEMQLRFSSMQIDVFALLTEARQRLASLRAAIDAKRAFWLAQSDLQTAVNGGGSGARENPTTTAAAAPVAGGTH